MKANVTLCDFCKKRVANDKCGVCEGDGCDECLPEQITLALTISKKSLKNLAREIASSHGRVINDSHTFVVAAQHRLSKCRKCMVAGANAEPILEPVLAQLIEADKAEWARQALLRDRVTDA